MLLFFPLLTVAADGTYPQRHQGSPGAAGATAPPGDAAAAAFTGLPASPSCWRRAPRGTDQEETRLAQPSVPPHQTWAGSKARAGRHSRKEPRPPRRYCHTYRSPSSLSHARGSARWAPPHTMLSHRYSLTTSCNRNAVLFFSAILIRLSILFSSTTFYVSMTNKNNYRPTGRFKGLK